MLVRLTKKKLSDSGTVNNVYVPYCSDRFGGKMSQSELCLSNDNVIDCVYYRQKHINVIYITPINYGK